jgi:hypothetical protein
MSADCWAGTDAGGVLSREEAGFFRLTYVSMTLLLAVIRGVRSFAAGVFVFGGILSIRALLQNGQAAGEGHIAATCPNWWHLEHCTTRQLGSYSSVRTKAPRRKIPS